MTSFNPNAASVGDCGIFGLPYSTKESSLVLIPVPWDTTTSYKPGTAKGPAAILEASKQVDLYDGELGTFYTAGISMLDIPTSIEKLNTKLRPKAETIIAKGGTITGKTMERDVKAVNAGSDEVNAWVEKMVRAVRKQGKIAALIGGEHSTPFGAFKAYLDEFPDMAILQIDAHCDLRQAFEGFEHSHASIMYNAVTKLPLKKLVQVSIRDFCEDEYQMITKNPKKITTFFDHVLARNKASGVTWLKQVKAIVKTLPKHVFISFDIDGLNPALCPHTGTPVPGGLESSEAVMLIRAVVESGRIIVGFDLNEVSPSPRDEWDANVGARMLYKLCGWTLRSQKKA